MLDALRARDVYLVAGCAAAGVAVPRRRHAAVRRRAGAGRSARQRDATEARSACARSARAACDRALVARCSRRALAPHARRRRSSPACSTRRRRVPRDRRRRTAGSAPFIYPLDARQPARAALRGGPHRRACRSRWFAGGRLVRSSDDAARAAAAARRRQLRPRRLQPAAVRRAHLAGLRDRRGARRDARSARCSAARRLRRRRGGRSADAGDRVRDGAAGDVRRAGAAGGAAAGAAAGGGLRAARRHLRRRRRAVRRPRRPRHRPLGAARSTTPSAAHVARRQRRRGCWSATCCRRRAASSPCRSRCWCRRSSSPKRRCRTSASAFPSRWRAGARCCTTRRRTSGCSPTFPWLLSPAAAMFLVVLGLNLRAAEQAGGRSAAVHEGWSDRDVESTDESRRASSLRSHPLRRPRPASTRARLRAALAALDEDAARPASSSSARTAKRR